MSKSKKTKVIASSIIGFLIIAAIVFFQIVPHQVDRIRNGLGAGITEQAPASIPEWNKDLRIVDLHADTLLWDRDLLERGTRGHVDLPRLLEGPITLQVFSAVTKSPRGLNLQSNKGDTDNITILAMAQRWPFAAWGSLSERALYQARRLHEAVANSDGKLRLVRSQADLQRLLDERNQPQQMVGAILAIEGAHALEGDLAKLQALQDAGYRVISPAHMFDSEIAGSQQGEHKGGLTELGRKWVQEMNQRSLIIDLAHISHPAMDEILQISTKPVMVSHTGVKAVCDINRNLSDEYLKKVAERGGLIGLGMWEEIMCGKSLDGLVDSLEHVSKLVGIDHVALGSDWDGFVSTPVDAARIGWVTAKLHARGWSREDVQKVMGENALRFFAQNLPPQ